MVKIPHYLSVCHEDNYARICKTEIGFSAKQFIKSHIIKKKISLILIERYIAKNIFRTRKLRYNEISWKFMKIFYFFLIYVNVII